MLRKLIGNDLRNHVFLSVVTTLFMAICAMLLALTIMLFLNLSGAIDSLMEQAQTPDFVAAGAFLMVVPGKLYSTISAPQFVTYMGIGDGEVRLDVRQTENITGMTERLKELLDGDSRVEKSTVLVTKSFRLLEEDGGSSNLTVELGDHSVFPVTYSRGAAPRGDRELALSAASGESFVSGSWRRRRKRTGRERFWTGWDSWAGREIKSSFFTENHIQKENVKIKR